MKLLVRFALPLGLLSLPAFADEVLEPCGKNHYILELPCAVESPDPSKWTWFATGTLNVPRSGHTATLLANGNVVVAGGGAPQEPPGMTSAETYDPSSGRWTRTGDMLIARWSHAAVRMPDGKVLVTGGNTLGWVATPSAEVYDPITGSWTMAAPMSAPRSDHTMTLLADGTVMVTGGLNEDYFRDDKPLGTAEIYDPASGAWRSTASLRTARIAHTATALPDGTVLIAGGSTQVEFHGYTATSELYDPHARVWLPAGEFSIPFTNYNGAGGRSHFATTLLDDGSVLLVGGYSDCNRTFNGASHYLCSYAATDRYVPGLGWSEAGNLHSPRSGHTITRLSTGHLIVVAGHDWTPGTPSFYLETTELYDPKSKTWQAAPSLVNIRGAHTATLLADGTVLVANGQYAEIFGPDRRVRK